MSGYEELAKELAKIAAQVAIGELIGKKLEIKYGLRKFWEKLDIKLHFTVAINFYSLANCQRVYEILSDELRKYYVKNDNMLKRTPQMNFGSHINYEYYLSIVSAQDDILLGILDLDYLSTIAESAEISIETPLTASAARLFLWPSNMPNKISLNEFRDLLSEVYDFYKEFSERLLDYMKSNKLHDFETKLFVELDLNSRSAKVLQNVIRRLPNKIRGNFYLNLDAQKKIIKDIARR